MTHTFGTVCSLISLGSWKLDSLQDHTTLGITLLPLALDPPGYIDHNDFYLSSAGQRVYSCGQLIKDKTPSPPRFTGSRFRPESLVQNKQTQSTS